MKTIKDKAKLNNDTNSNFVLRKLKPMMFKTISMKVALVIFTLALGSQAQAANNKTTSQDAAIQQYYQDQTIKQIEQFIPKGKFSVQVKAEIDYRKINQEHRENENPPMALPALGAMIPVDQKSEGGVQASIDELLHFVKKVEISVSLAPEVTAQAKEMIANAISNMVTFDAKRGDKISFGALPTSMNESSMTMQHPAIVTGAGIFVSMLFITFMFLFGMSKIAGMISKEFLSISSKLQNAFEGGGMMPSAFSPGNPMSPSTSQGNADNADSYQPGEADFWERIDHGSITAFMFDCHSTEKTRGVPHTLLNELYNQETIEQIENTIPSSILAFHDQHAVLSMSEIHHLFHKNHGEYRKAHRSPLAKALLRLEAEKINEFKSNFDLKEMVVLMNFMTPLKRSKFVSLLDAETKVNIAKMTKSSFTTADVSKNEVKLIEKLTVIADSKDNKEQYDFSALTELLFKSNSFAEDEQNFTKAADESSFFSPLMCLSAFNNEVWDEFSPQEAALAFWGYSDEYKQQLIGNYTGKKHEWIKNFLTKFEQSKPDFNSTAVEKVREKFKEKYQAVKTSGEKSDKEKAS